MLKERHRIGETEIGSGGQNSPLQVSPSRLWKVQSQSLGAEFAELPKERLGNGLVHPSGPEDFPSASLRLFSSSRERKSSRSWMNIKPSSSFMTPSMCAMPGRIFSEEITSPVPGSTIPRASSTKSP